MATVTWDLHALYIHSSYIMCMWLFESRATKPRLAWLVWIKQHFWGRSKSESPTEVHKASSGHIEPSIFHNSAHVFNGIPQFYCQVHQLRETSISVTWGPLSTLTVCSKVTEALVRLSLPMWSVHLKWDLLHSDEILLTESTYYNS